MGVVLVLLLMVLQLFLLTSRLPLSYVLPAQRKDFLVVDDRTIIGSTMKPPFSYYGGKTKLAKHIVPLIPKHTVYCEPFCGSGAVMFAKPWPDIKNQDHYREVLNDLDKRIFTFFTQLQAKDSREALIQRLQCTPYHEHFYQKAQAICREPESYSEEDQAWAFFVSISMSFANKLNRGWGRTTYKYNQAATWNRSMVPHLAETMDRFSATYFSCMDALTCIEYWDSPQTLFYCDPPYVGTDQGHYDGYTQKDLEALIEKLDKCQGSFILSGYDNIAYPKHWERFEFDALAHASGKGKVKTDKSKSLEERDLGDKRRKEIVLRVIRNHNVRKEIKTLFESGNYDCFTGDSIKPPMPSLESEAPKQVQELTGE